MDCQLVMAADHRSTDHSAVRHIHNLCG